MEHETLVELACDHIDRLSDMAAAHQNAGDEVSKWVCINEIKELSRAMDSDDDLFFMTYHRYLSDNFGVEFEIDHGDEELMFGGV